MESPAASLRLDAGRLTLAWKEAAACRHMVARCRLADGSYHDSARWTPIGTVDRSGGRLRTRSGPIEVMLDIRSDGKEIGVTLEATAKRACTVRDIGLAFLPEIQGEEPQWVRYNGFQSWDAAGLARLRRPNGEEAKRESWWTCGLCDASGGGIAIAAKQAESWATRFEVRPTDVAVFQCPPEGLTTKTVMWEAEKGDAWRSEPLTLGAGRDLQAVLAGILAPEPVEKPVPRGWLSWYHYGAWISRQDVLENAALVAEGPMRDLGYHVVQIDDGWQEAYGEWRPNSKFGPDFNSIAKRLHEAGQVPGVWTAPFLVSASADLAHEAPHDWFVVDPLNGERAVDHRHQVFGPMYILNASHPAVCEHLEATFSKLYDTGFRYFKIDFLYAGAYAGCAALRAGVGAIRRAIGDSYLLACGAPLLPLKGLCDGCRIGQDTATPLYNFELGAPSPTIFGSEIESVARNVAARHLLSPWFHLDADVALVGGNLNIRQARQLVTVVALSGGPFFASDDLALIPPDRLALLTNREVLGLVGGNPAVPDWEPNDQDLPPTVWRRGQEVIAVFNWTDLERRIEVPVQDRCRVRDIWSGAELGEFAGCLRLDLEPSGVRLLKLDTA